MAGVVVVHSKPEDMARKTTEVMSYTEKLENATTLEEIEDLLPTLEDRGRPNVWLGVACILSAAVTSGFAGVRTVHMHYYLLRITGRVPVPTLSHPNAVCTTRIILLLQ